MCGITSYIDKIKTNVAVSEVAMMANKMAHRGPDGEGIVAFHQNMCTAIYTPATPKAIIHTQDQQSPSFDIQNANSLQANIALAHRRLSVIEPSVAGHQPYCDSLKRYWITFNGEVYNYEELRKELQTQGVSFHSNTDIEVVLKSFVFWGEKCVDKFEGMWAFIIYDSQEQTMFGARDHFGVKPFYYINNESCLAIASEQKALYELTYFSPKLNEKAVFDYLLLGELENDTENFVKGIYELRPGHTFYYQVKEDKLEVKKYYSLDYTTTWKNFTAEERTLAIDKIQSLIKKGITSHLKSDVPVGSCLSGGLDSSIIVGQIHQLLKEQQFKGIKGKQYAFTASLPGYKWDETKFAETVINDNQADWLKIEVTGKEWIKKFRDLVYTHDIPFVSTSTFSQYKVFELVQKSGVKVTLDGQGADELFSGYAPHYAAFIQEAKHHRDQKVVEANPPEKQATFNTLEMVTKYPAKMKLASKLPRLVMRKLYLKNGFEYRFISKKFIKKHTSRIDQITNKWRPNLNKQLHYEFSGSGIKGLMRTGDRNSMRFGVEARVPFTDHRELVEYVFQLPSTIKIHHSFSKTLLREAMKEVLPKEIYERRDKVGFSTPEQDWFQQYSQEIKSWLPHDPDEFIQWDKVHENWQELVDDALKNGTTRLWRIVNFAVWRDVFSI